MGKLIRMISENGGVVVYAVDSTDIVSFMENRHKTSATASAALGRLLTAASLMGSMQKSDKESMTVRIKADGSAGSLVAVSDYLGNVRGYVENPMADAPINPKTNKLDVAGIVGTTGSLYIIKDLGLKEPYVGMVPIVSGEIAEDITSYYANSQQVPTVCALGVLVNPDLSIKKAGGFILQLLPGATEQEIELIERNIAKVGSVTELLDGGTDIEEIAKLTLDGFNPQLLNSYDVEYKCLCSREKTLGMLKTLGQDELSEMANDEKQTEVVCNFCMEKYLFSKQEMLDLVEGIQK